MKAKALISRRFQHKVFGADLGIRFGPKTYVAVIVPNVIGMTLDAATAELAGDKLSIRALGDIEQVASAQSPEPGETVAPGSDVTVFFGEFPNLIVNGTFNTDLSGWDDISEAPSQVIWNGAGTAMFRGMADGMQAGLNQMVQIIPASVGRTFEGSYSISSLSSGGGYEGIFMVGTITQPYKYLNRSINATGAFTFSFEPTELDIVVRVIMQGVGSSFQLDNVVLRRAVSG
jgi:hypothetical protein